MVHHTRISYWGPLGVLRRQTVPTCGDRPVRNRQCRDGNARPRRLPALRPGDYTESIESGPFTFTIGLYSDPSLKSPAEADHPSRASDIPGVGWRAMWTYDGPTTGPATQLLGSTAEWARDPDSNIPTIVAGQSDGRSGGGIVLPEGVESGDQLELGLKIAIPEGPYGALVSFRVASDADRTAARDVVIKELRHG